MTMSQAAPVRVLITDDDPTYRQILTKCFREIPGVEVVATAATLAGARDKITHERIDLITVDVVMHGESGLDLLPWLQKHHPRVVSVLITSGTVPGASETVDALLLGATTLIRKPDGLRAKEQLVNALSSVVQALPATEQQQRRSLANRPIERAQAQPRSVIAVGASTGGPPVVLQFLKSLPRDLQVPVLLTQHMPALHMPYYVELLARDSGRKVALVTHGETVRPGTVHVAGGGLHMKVRRDGNKLVILEDDGPEEHFCKPAVDPMFRSVADACGADAVGVVMTGMGQDGALGAVALRKRGAPVVIQNRETSVVWGMPGAVAAAGAASETVPSSELADAVMRWTSGFKTSIGEVGP